MNAIASIVDAVSSSIYGVRRCHLPFISNKLKRLHRNRDGSEVAMTMLMMAAVGIPLIIVLIAFSSDIVDILWDATQKLKPLE